jgi:hypothetical protein
MKVAGVLAPFGNTDVTGLVSRVARTSAEAGMAFALICKMNESVP